MPWLRLVFCMAAALSVVTTALSSPPAAGAEPDPTARILLAPTSGPPGALVTVQGRDYQAGEAIDVYEEAILTSTVQAGARGTFSTEIRINRQFAPGIITIEAVGRVSGSSAEALFTIRTNWRQFLRDPAHSGLNPFENLIRPDNVELLVERWRAPTANILSFSGPVVVDGVLYIGAGDGRVRAFVAEGCDPKQTCSPIWKSPSVGTIHSTPAVYRDTVFIGSEEGGLFALDAATGALSWTGPTGAAFASPVVQGGVVYIGDRDGLLFAYDADGCGALTCEPLWTGATPDALTTPAVGRGMVFANSLDGNLYAFDAAGCGRQECPPVWRGATGGGLLSAPAVSGATVFVGGLDSQLHAFAGDGCGAHICFPLWVGTGASQFVAGVAATKKVVYAAAHDGYLRAYPTSGCGADSCDPLWTASTGFAADSPPAIAGGVAFLPEAGGLLAFDAYGCGTPTCDRLAFWAISFPDGPPSAVDGMVFVGGIQVTALGFPPLGG